MYEIKSYSPNICSIFISQHLLILSTSSSITTISFLRQPQSSAIGNHRLQPLTLFHNDQIFLKKIVTFNHDMTTIFIHHLRKLNITYKSPYLNENNQNKMYITKIKQSQPPTTTSDNHL